MGADHNTATLTPPFAALADLASARVGGRAIAANDEFRAKVQPAEGRAGDFVPDRFTPRGKWMDGWETRRRRTPGHDWCVIALGMRGMIRGINVDTSHFTGNYPSHCSLEGIDSPRTPTPSICAADRPWVPLLPTSPLRGNGACTTSSLFVHDRPWTHARLNIFPDGGVARLRVYGDVAVDGTRVARQRRAIDLASITNGGLVIGASDMHFGAKDNMIMPGRATNMGDGWETRRRRGPGYDWAIVRLGTTAAISKVEIDTNHFKGNYPESASLEGCAVPSSSLRDLGSAAWREILPRTPLKPHHRHFYSRELATTDRISHVRLNIFPDGGISRLRIYGHVAGD